MMYPGDEDDGPSDQDIEEEMIEKQQEAAREEAMAERALERAIREDDDMTGQDNEDEINACAADLIDARNRRLRAVDPESYNERRQMGLL